MGAKIITNLLIGYFLVSYIYLCSTDAFSMDKSYKSFKPALVAGFVFNLMGSGRTNYPEKPSFTFFKQTKKGNL